MRVDVKALVTAFAVAGACPVPWAQPVAGSRAATPAAKLVKKCKDLATRQERADCTRLARERGGGIARAAGATQPGPPTPGTSDKMAVGAASAPVGAASGGLNDRLTLP